MNNRIFQITSPVLAFTASLNLIIFLRNSLRYNKLALLTESTEESEVI